MRHPERRVNQGGEPGHDDYGLPRVDIQIPDDARELYRDVQAYHRELRAMRRRERSRRWRAPLRRSGKVVPLIAGCLVLAMIGSMVVTMFSANPFFSGIPGHEHARVPAASGGLSAQPGLAAPTGSTAGSGTGGSPADRSASATHQPSAGPSPMTGVRLPGKTIKVAGRPVLLRGLTSTALVMVPSHCGCASLISQLLSQAHSAGVPIYLVGTSGRRAELAGYVTSAGPKTSRTAFVAVDDSHVLDAVYKPAGLTILLVDSHGSVTVTRGLRPGSHLATQFRSLKPAG